MLRISATVKSKFSMVIEELPQPDGSLKPGRQAWEPLRMSGLSCEGGLSPYDVFNRRHELVELEYGGLTWHFRGAIIVPDGNDGWVAMAFEAASVAGPSTEGPKAGEKWTIGARHDLVFAGQARDFAEAKHFIFRDGDELFTITKDEFFAPGLHKAKQPTA